MVFINLQCLFFIKFYFHTVTFKAYFILKLFSKIVFIFVFNCAYDRFIYLLDVLYCTLFLWIKKWMSHKYSHCPLFIMCVGKSHLLVITERQILEWSLFICQMKTFVIPILFQTKHNTFLLVIFLEIELMCWSWTKGL